MNRKKRIAPKSALTTETAINVGSNLDSRHSLFWDFAVCQAVSEEGEKNGEDCYGRSE
jgi:hypothetical protein